MLVRISANKSKSYSKNTFAMHGSGNSDQKILNQILKPIRPTWTQDIHFVQVSPSLNIGIGFVTLNRTVEKKMRQKS